MNRRSGMLAITTPAGAGEVRLVDGEVVDAVYKKLEGDKALYRLLGERDGSFAFVPGEPTGIRRIQLGTSMLLMEAMRQIDELARRRVELAPGGDALLMEDAPSQPPPELTPAAGMPRITSAAQVSGSKGAGPVTAPPLPAEVAELVSRDLCALLQVPRSIDELLDELTAPDLAILDVLAELSAAGRIRRVPLAALTTPLATPEQLPVLRSLVTRLTRAGFSPPPRLVIAAGAKRMPALAHAVRRITDASVPSEGPPRAPLPRTLGTLRLGEGVELAITGLPTDDAFSPTWALNLPGAAAVVRLSDAGGEALEAYCASVEVTLIDAESLMGSLDAAVPAQVAALVRSALEMAAGV